MSSYPNPNTVSGIPSGWSIEFFGGTNAAYLQQVIVSQGSTVLATFNGSGEGGTLLDGSGSAVFNYTATGSDITLTFRASSNNGTSYADATIVRLNDSSSTSVMYWDYGTEDFNDGDNNDTVFTVIAKNHS